MKIFHWICLHFANKFNTSPWNIERLEVLQLPEWSSLMFTLEDLELFIVGPTPKHKTIKQVKVCKTYPARKHLSLQLPGTVFNLAIVILTQFANFVF